MLNERNASTSSNAQSNKNYVNDTDVNGIVISNAAHDPGVYEIFVSQFPSTTECDAITALIVEKTDLDTEKFEVIKMVSSKNKNKYIKFMSFKIKATDEVAYNKILDVKIWAPFTKAVPIDVNPKSKSKQR